MTHPVLGEWSNGAAVKLDLPRLIETRLLIQSNSGGGKSRALRRLLEVTTGEVQQIIIDPEGEFASLREKHDLVICAAQGADAATHPRTAALLGRRLLEVEASAVLDISELKARERHAFVRLLLESLIEAPKSMRHSVLVVIDECQIYCPEKGQGESEASGAVIDLATRGRKRGLCLVAATQRISMLHKSVAGECKNRLIGGTSLDVDVKRAAFDLGMPPTEALSKLRALEPGHFFAFGPALHQLEPREMVTGEVLTTHPKVGHRQWTAPPKPTAAIVALLPKLSDLPKEAEQEARTAEDLRRELATARRELTLARKAAPAAGPSRQELAAAEERGYERGHAAGRQEAQRAAAAHLKGLRSAAHKALESALSVAPDPLPNRPTATVTVHPDPRTISPAMREALGDVARVMTRAVQDRSNGADEKLPRAERAILTVLAQYPDGRSRSQVSILSGYSANSSSFANALSALRVAGYITREDPMRATPEGLATLGPFDPLPQGDELLRHWCAKLGKAEQTMLQVLAGKFPDAMTRDELSESTGYSITSSSFANALSKLRVLELVNRGAEIRASDALFQEA